MQQVSARQILKKLEEGRHVPVNYSLPIDKKPQWLNLERFHRGRKVNLGNYYSCNLGYALSHFWMGQYQPIVLTLIYTGKSSTIPAMCQRFNGSVYHVYQWYHGDVWDVKGEAHQSIKTLRKIHSHISKRMSAESREPTDPPVWIAQYDMAMVQFASLCVNVLFPEKVGIKCSDDDLMCLVHFWAGIGFLLGIEDRFNLGLQCETLEDTRTLFKEIVEQEIKPAWNQSNEVYYQILQTLSAVLREVDPSAEHGCNVRLALDMIDVPDVLGTESWDTAICLAVRSVLINCASKPVIGPIINTYSWIRLWHRAKIHKGKYNSNFQLLLDLGSQLINGVFQKICLKKKICNV